MDHEPEIRLRVESRVIRVLNPRRSNFIAENGESFFRNRHVLGSIWSSILRSNQLDDCNSD